MSVRTMRRLPPGPISPPSQLSSRPGTPNRLRVASTKCRICSTSATSRLAEPQRSVLTELLADLRPDRRIRLGARTATHYSRALRQEELRNRPPDPTRPPRHEGNPAF